MLHTSRGIHHSTRTRVLRLWLRSGGAADRCVTRCGDGLWSCRGLLTKRLQHVLGKLPDRRAVEGVVVVNIPSPVVYSLPKTPFPTCWRGPVYGEWVAERAGRLEHTPCWAVEN